MKIKRLLKGSKAGIHSTRSRAGSFFIILILILMAMFMGLPFYYAIIQSLKPMDELFIFPPRFYVSRPSLNSFYSLMQYAGSTWVPFTRYLFNSLFVTGVATFFQIFLCSLAAYVFSKGTLKCRNVIFNFIVVALLFSGSVMAVPTYVVMSSLKLINTYWSLILPAIASPLGLFLMKQFMDASVPNSLIEAAKVDGASTMKIFWSIVMPVVKPAWLTLIIFAFQQIWNLQGLEYIFDERLKVLPTMFSQIAAAGAGRADVAAAATVVLIIPPILAFILAQSRVLQTMAHSGIK